MGCLKEHLPAESRKIDNTRNTDITDSWEIFVHTDTGSKGTFTQCDITHMFHDAQRGIHCYDKGIWVV